MADQPEVRETILSEYAQNKESILQQWRDKAKENVDQVWSTPHLETMIWVSDLSDPDLFLLRTLLDRLDPAGRPTLD